MLIGLPGKDGEHRLTDDDDNLLLSSFDVHEAFAHQVQPELPDGLGQKDG